MDELLQMWDRVRPDFMEKVAISLKLKIPLALGVGGGLAGTLYAGKKLLSMPMPETRLFKQRMARKATLRRGSAGSYVPFRGGS